MELDNKKILEILLGLILIVLLVMIIVLILPSTNSTGSTTTTITNSFNTNNYYNIYTKDIYTKTYPKKIEKYNYLDFDYSAYKKTKKGILGNNVEHYSVYVKNQDYKSGNFKVKYYFTDYYGNTKTEISTHYIKPKQTKEFVYKNIHQDKYKFYDWNYEIISTTRT